MVFIGGPRQVGKTTLADSLIAGRFRHPAYYNWDSRSDRKTIINSLWPGNADLVVLDELHKYRKWKGFVKGEYDKHKEHINFILTGSARMDVFRKGGDSLQGRYHHFRLHPFSVAELAGRSNSISAFQPLMLDVLSAKTELGSLWEYGGFPEPIIKHSERFLRRWHREKLDRLFREDILDVEAIRDIGSMKLLSDLLPERVGSLLSTNALREDLEVSFKAVAHWLDILETFYYHFRIYPFTSRKIRSIKKEPKLYLWDWSEIAEAGQRFENMIASHLLKLVHFMQDYEGYNAELCFIRDLAQKELDFVVTINAKPWFAVEVKLEDDELAPALPLFKEKWNIPFCYQVVKKSGVDFLSKNIRVISAEKFLAALI
jgi:predicted AAA+ superfamily ATPase